MSNMNNIPRGKGLFHWKHSAEDFLDILDEIQRVRPHWVTIKAADGPYPSTSNAMLFDKLVTMGIQVRVWAYVYPNHTAEQVKKGIMDFLSACEFGDRVTGLDINAEREFRDLGKYGQATKIVQACRDIQGAGRSISLCSYRFPSLHQGIYWAEWADAVDFFTPQVYWMSTQNGGWQVQNTFEEYSKITNKPLVPVLPAFKEYGWQPTHESIMEAVDKCSSNNAPSIAFYRTGHITEYGYSELLSGIEYPGFQVVPITSGGLDLYAISLVQGLRIRSAPVDGSIIGSWNPEDGKKKILEMVPGLSGSTWVRTEEGWTAFYARSWYGLRQYLLLTK